MRFMNWIKAVTLVTVVAFGLAACDTVKPVSTYDSTIALDAPVTVVRGGDSFIFTTTLTYQVDGEVLPLANQEVEFLGEEFGLMGDTFKTDENGTIELELVAPMLPERERERDAWVRVHFGGSVIEFRDVIGRFRDANNSRYFTIKQQTPGLNNPGIPGSELN